MAERKTAKRAELDALELKEEVEAERAPREPRLWWWLGLLGAGALFLACTWLAHRHTLTGPNLALFRYINNLPDILRAVALVIIVAPSSLVVGAAAVVVTFALKLFQLSWQLAAAVFIAGGLGMVLKKLIAEPRPYGMVSDVHIRAHEVDPGFPSGHTLMVAVVVCTLLPYLPRGWRLVALAWIPLMGLARIYLGVHTAVDVTGGFALGVALVSAMRLLPEGWRRLARFD